MTHDESLIPTVGLGVTLHHPSDCYGGVVTRVSPNRRTIWFRLDGFSDEPERRGYLDKRGTWRVSKGYAWLRLGVRETYLDPGA